MDQIYAGLTEIFQDLFGDDAIRLHPATTAADIPEWDSFQHINLVVAVEMRFGIKFATTEVEALRNVGDLAALIARKQARGGAGMASWLSAALDYVPRWVAFQMRLLEQPARSASFSRTARGSSATGPTAAISLAARPFPTRQGCARISPRRR